jgi:flagellin FlaB
MEKQMFNKLNQAVHNLYHGKKGITGLETAIILIAFVTVAAVLAYTVLSAGIFSSERGKEAVYGGLEGAQSTMEVKGSTIATSGTVADGDNDGTADDPVTGLATVKFTLALAIPGSQVDMNSIVVNYFDDDDVEMGLARTTYWTYVISPGSTERGSATILEGDEQMVVTVDLAALETALDTDFTPPVAYDQFTIQVVPPSGATLTVQKTLPGGLTSVFSLN